MTGIDSTAGETVSNTTGIARSYGDYQSPRPRADVVTRPRNLSVPDRKNGSTGKGRRYPKSTPSSPPQEAKEFDYSVYIRVEYVQKLVDLLQDVSPHAGSMDSSLYALRIFNLIRVMQKEMRQDPVMQVVFALHDALACRENWLRYSEEQYQKASQILVHLTNRDKVDLKAIDTALFQLEDAGFDTLPFVADLNEENDE